MSDLKYRQVYRHYHSPWRVIWLLIKWQLGDYGKRCDICGFYEAAHYNYDLQFDIDNYPCTFETFHKSQLTVKKESDV